MVVLKMFPVNANFRAKMHKFDCLFRKLFLQNTAVYEKLILRKQGQTMRNSTQKIFGAKYIYRGIPIFSS